MPRLPIPGQDSGTWGSVLNDFLAQSHDASGNLLPSAVSAGIANSSITGAQIANTTITDANVATNAAIAQSKINNLTTDLSSKLTAANNLSDVASAATARTNLSVAQSVGFTKITVGTVAPSSPAVGDVWIDTN